MSESHKGHTSGMRDKHHTEASKKKISDGLNQYYTNSKGEETKRQISESLKGPKNPSFGKPCKQKRDPQTGRFIGQPIELSLR